MAVLDTAVQDAQAILGLISTSEDIGSSLKDEGVLAVEKSGRITGGGNNLFVNWKKIKRDHAR